ncbi:hypothetical protein Hte_005956 [Hypoxylon texense]
MSAVLGTTTLTPPSSSHADHSGWKQASANHHDNSMPHKLPTSRHETNGSVKGISPLQNGDSDYDPYASNNYFTNKDQRTNQSNSASDHKRPNADITPSEPEFDDEHSKWIHRDKLARIENQELQAAGIILPKPRARSRPGRDRSQDKTNGNRRGTDASEQPPAARSRKNSELSLDKTLEIEVPSWDLRLPEEIAEDPGEYFVPNGTVKSRIPVAKLSPAPIPVDFLDRDAPVRRQPSYAVLDEDASIAMRKPRSRSGSSNALEAPKMQSAKRSVTEGSPKKGTTAGAVGARKTSAPAKTPTQGRPKTRSGPAPRSNSTTRPTTRSGELSPVSKAAPEGEPPWMISAYKPDPRLPPDQQLLPTVAKRLQQEKWEQEGKFGNIYDKEFRPLNEEGFLKPPELEKPKDAEERQDEWPLRAGAKSPNTGSRPGTSSYSTMPRIQDTPAMSPLASPRTPQQPQIQAVPSPRVPTQVEQPQEKPKKSGCGCCIVM